MKYTSKQIQNILTSKTAIDGLDYITPIYHEAETALWIMEAMGLQADLFVKWVYEIAEQILPQTATWSLDYWEEEYGLPVHPNISMEQRRAKILNAVREKGQVTYKGRPIRITPDFSTETMKARRSWADVIQTLREHKCQPRLLYPAKLSITIDGETKVFHDKTKFTHYLSTNPALQRIITEKNQYKDGNHALEKTRR